MKNRKERMRKERMACGKGWRKRKGVKKMEEKDEEE